MAFMVSTPSLKFVNFKDRFTNTITNIITRQVQDLEINIIKIIIDYALMKPIDIALDEARANPHAKYYCTKCNSIYFIGKTCNHTQNLLFIGFYTSISYCKCGGHYVDVHYGSTCINDCSNTLNYCALTFIGDRVCRLSSLGCIICGGKTCYHGAFKEINCVAVCIDCHFKIKVNNRINELYLRENLNDFISFKRRVRNIIEEERAECEKFITQKRSSLDYY